MKRDLSRRHFLSIFGKAAVFAPMGSLMYDTLLGQVLNRAAATTGNPALNPNLYLHMSFASAPPRWYFDLPLAPMGLHADTFAAGGFGTLYTGTGADPSVGYVTAPQKLGGETVQLPPLWNMAPAGQDFRKLLDHTLFIRGMDMEINSHPLSNARQVAPIVNGMSVSGMLADVSNLPIPSISGPEVESVRAFRTKKGLSYSRIDYTSNANVNPIITLLKSFRGEHLGRATHNARNIALQHQALKEFDKYAEAHGITESALSNMYEAANTLVEGGIFNEANRWAAIQKKYADLCTAALNPALGSIAGLNDRAIPTISGDARFRFAQTNQINTSDLRRMIDPSTRIAQMAENFAIAEMLLGRVTSTMTLQFSNMSNLLHDGGRFALTHDQHFVGAPVSVIATTLFYRAFLSCMSELVAYLKEAKMFDRTVIHMGSEFNRSPRIDASGSDHGVSGSGCSIISGMLAEGGIVGNIAVNKSATSNYKGTWGVATDFDMEGMKRPIQVNDVALTLTSMLGVDNVVTNGRSVLQPKNGKWVLKKKEANNV